jgi:hypothetical protein
VAKRPEPPAISVMGVERVVAGVLCVEGIECDVTAGGMQIALARGRQSLDHGSGLGRSVSGIDMSDLASRPAAVPPCVGVHQ